MLHPLTLVCRVQSERFLLPSVQLHAYLVLLDRTTMPQVNYHAHHVHEEHFPPFLAQLVLVIAHSAKLAHSRVTKARQALIFVFPVVLVLIPLKLGQALVPHVNFALLARFLRFQGQHCFLIV